MPHAGQGSGPVPAFNIDARAIQSFLLQASGARERACDYCGSTIPVGERACQGCGAAVSTMAPQEHGNGSGDRNQWIVPLLLCFFFPPAMLIVLPVMFWRWLRRERRNWIVPLLACFLFPPAVLLVVPAFLWPSAGRRKAN